MENTQIIGVLTLSESGKVDLALNSKCEVSLDLKQVRDLLIQFSEMLTQSLN